MIVFWFNNFIWFNRVKGLGDTDSEDDSASTWTEKLKAKQEADKKVRNLIICLRIRVFL